MAVVVSPRGRGEGVGRVAWGGVGVARGTGVVGGKGRGTPLGRG